MKCVAIALLNDGGLQQEGAAEVALGVGVMGLLVTLGVLVYEVRNSMIHDRAIHRLKFLEKLLGLSPAVQATGPGGFFSERGGRLTSVGISLWHDRELAIIYDTVVAGWAWLIYTSLTLEFEWTPHGLFEVAVPVAAGLLVAIELHRLSDIDRPGGRTFLLGDLEVGKPQEAMAVVLAILHKMKAHADGDWGVGPRKGQA